MTKNDQASSQRFVQNLHRMVLQGTMTVEEAFAEHRVWLQGMRKRRIQEISRRVLERRDEAINRLSSRLKAQG